MKTVWVYTRDIYEHNKLDIACISETADEVSNWLVNQGLIIPIEFDDTVINPRLIKITDDNGTFIVSKDLEKEAAFLLSIQKEKLKLKKDMANDIIIHINSIIDQWTISEKVTLLGRQDIQVILSFLNYGSIEQSLQLVAAITPDATLTQEIKDSVSSFISLKIAEFNAMTWS